MIIIFLDQRRVKEIVVVNQKRMKIMIGKIRVSERIANQKLILMKILVHTRVRIF